MSSVWYIEAWSTKNYVEVHTIDTNARIILDAKINVFLNTEVKVASITEVRLTQFVLTHLQAPLQDFLGLSSTNGAMTSDLLITLDTKGTHGVTGFGRYGLLTGKTPM